MSYTLYGTLTSVAVHKVQIVAHFVNIPLNFVNVSDPQNYEQIKEHTPTGKFPLLQTPQGYIFESNAIIKFLARTAQKGYGNDVFTQSQVDQWLDFQNQELFSRFFEIFYQVLGYGSFGQEVFKKALKDVEDVLKIIDQHLTQNKYLVGNEVTIADIGLGVLVLSCFRTFFDSEKRKSVPHLTKWMEEVFNLESFKLQFGRARFAKTPIGNLKN